MDDGTTHDALPLRTVSRMTGLSPDIIRAWEKRYGVVAPKRGARGARLYSLADIARLRLLRQVVGGGRAIGDVARLSPAELEALAGSPVLAADGRQRSAAPDGHLDVVGQAVAALARFDGRALDRCLGDALMALGSREFILQVAAPLLGEIGDRWSDGRLTIADEHLLSGQMRNLLSGMMRARGPVAAPTVLLATPQGERHEFGLLLAGLLIADAGLGLCYLGADLPAAEIVAAAQRAGVSVVGLGLVNEDNHRPALDEVRGIERGLAPSTELWLGGRAAAAVRAEIGASRAVVLDRIDTLEAELQRVRADNGARA
ncbi:MAG: MerR family transcriptional regulator [Candidatus Binatia bacterium]